MSGDEHDHEPDRETESDQFCVYSTFLYFSFQVKREDLQKGMVYPELTNIRSISASIAEGVCIVAEREGLTGVDRPSEGWLKKCLSSMWWPNYEDYV